MNVVAVNGAGPSAAVQSQFGLINLLKAIAAQLIVLHHLAFYGPMADVAWPLMPELLDWLKSWGRVAVQVFLVIGGFLAAKSLSPSGNATLSDPWGRVARRYAKLMPPFLVAMMVAIAASAIARMWMNHDSISAPATMPQLAAHALLLHSVLGYESLSAGAWYVAIDFQLFAVMTFLLWFSGRYSGHRPLPWLMPAVITVCVIASLLYFNRDSDWDNWAPYFFGSYGLGALAWWASDPKRRPASVALLVAMIVLPALAALTVEFRSRIAVALAVAVVLFLFGRAKIPVHAFRGFSVFNGLAKISYSIFLIHFPVCLVINAAFTRFVPADPHWQALGMLIAWAASLAAGAAFFRWVESPLGRVMTFAAAPVTRRPLAAS
jgi:peptidoglycan/LPS O-acetylase OafA/YrhL